MSDNFVDPTYIEIVEHLNTAVVMTNEDLVVNFINSAGENLFGISKNRALGKSVFNFLEECDDLHGVIDRALRTGDTYVNEMRLPKTEFRPERVVDCSVTAVLKDAEVRGLVIEMTDVTRRSRISRENALLVQHGSGRQMVRQLAHEIKNPLGGLRGAAQLLEKQLDSVSLKEYTKVIISEADRLADLVNTLLGPAGPLKKEPVNIHELLEYVVRLVAPNANRKINILRDYDPGLPEIKLDHGQMVQAFLNLLKNAIAALDGEGQIKLRTRAVMNFTIGDERYPVVAAIEIEDNGIGVDPELKEAIFFPLVTGHTKGTGLGLPVAQELINRHGGLIEFESCPGSTVFQVHLPVDLGERTSEK